MTVTQQMEADHLSQALIDYLKETFKGKKIKLTVETEMDETDYLLSDPKNKKRLLKSIKNLNVGKDTIEMTETLRQSLLS